MEREWYELDSKDVNNSNFHNEIDKKFSNNKQKILDITILRDYLIRGIREYLYDEDFTEINIPSVVSVATEPVKIPKRELFTLDWYGKEAFLSQSAQLHKQMVIALGLDKIFVIAPFWRSEERDTKRHLSEAWSLDVEVSGIRSYNDVISVLENILKQSSEYLNENCKRILERNNFEVSPLVSPFSRITYNDSVRILKENNVNIEIGEDIGPEREYELGKLVKRRDGKDIFFVERYPDSVKKFYVAYEEGNLTSTFDLIYKGWEIASGAKRETDYRKIESRIKTFGLSTDDYKCYLDIFKNGMPEHGGFGLGLDRYFARLLNLDDARKAVLFPRTKSLISP